MAVTGKRTAADVELFLSVWPNISVRVRKEIWPDTDAMVIAELEPAHRALPG